MDLIYWIMLIFWCVSAGIFFWIMRKDPRSLKSGLSFLGFLFFSGLFVLFLLMRYSEQIMDNRILALIILGTGGIILFLLLLFPLILIWTFVVEGLRLIRREGFSKVNLLSVLFGIGLALFLFVWPAVFTLALPSPVLFLALLVTGIVYYFLGIFLVFCFSSALNLTHFTKKQNLRQVIVLGSGLNKDKVTPLLAGRVDKGIELLKYNPDAVLIFSGGQGPGEEIPEAQAMANYAKEKGVDPSKLRLDDKSTDTKENLAFSQKLFIDPDGKTAVVSTGYHVFRALYLARSEQIPCIGYGAKTKLYFSMNALLREYIGYLSISWKTHLKVLAILLLPFAALTALYYGVQLLV